MSTNQKLTYFITSLGVLITVIVGFKDEIHNLIYRTDTLNININDKTGPLDKALIILEDSSTHKIIDSSRTDNQGRVRFLDIPFGLYNYYLTVNGISYRFDVRINGNETLNDTHVINKQDSSKHSSTYTVSSLTKPGKSLILKKKIVQIDTLKQQSNNVTSDIYAMINKHLPDTNKVDMDFLANRDNLSVSAYPEKDIPIVYYDTVDGNMSRNASNLGCVVFYTDCSDCNWKLYLKGFRSGNGVMISTFRPNKLSDHALYWDLIADQKYTYTIFDRVGNHYNYDINVIPKHTMRVFIRKR